MLITLNSPSELKQVTDYFGIPMNLAEVTVSFPYPFDLSKPMSEEEAMQPTKHQDKCEQLTFQEFEEKYLNKKI